MFLIEDTQERLQVAVNKWLEELQIKGIEINSLKNKVMIISHDLNEPIHIICNNEQLENINNYQYLGTIFSNERRIDQEVLKRDQEARPKGKWSRGRLMQRFCY